MFFLQLKSPMGSIGLRDYKFAAVTGDRPGHQNCFNLVSSGDKRIYYFSTSSRAVSTQIVNWH